MNNAWSDALVGPRPVVEFFKIHWLHLQQNINREKAGKKQFIGLKHDKKNYISIMLQYNYYKTTKNSRYNYQLMTSKLILQDQKESKR